MNAPQFGCEFEIDQYIPYSLRAVSTVCGFRLVSCHVSLNLYMGTGLWESTYRLLTQMFVRILTPLSRLDWNVRIKEQVAWIISRKT